MTSGSVGTVLVAPTAFKGTLGPSAVARAMAAGVTAVWPAAEVVERPLSDGGNGLVEACERPLGGTLSEHEVGGPLGEPVRARTLRAGRLAVIESAEACGLHLMQPQQRAPLRGLAADRSGCGWAADAHGRLANPVLNLRCRAPGAARDPGGCDDWSRCRGSRFWS